MPSLPIVLSDRFVLLLSSMTVGEAQRVIEGGQFTHFIIIKDNQKEGVLYYLLPLEPTVSRLARAGAKETVDQALDLHEQSPTPIVSAESDLLHLASLVARQAVILGEEGIIGFLDDASTVAHAEAGSQAETDGWAEALLRLGTTRETDVDAICQRMKLIRCVDHGDRPMVAYPGGYVNDIRRQMARIRHDLHDDVCQMVKPSQRGIMQVYPALDAPSHVTPEAEFVVQVGFRLDLDPMLATPGRIEIPDESPDERCLAWLSADGAIVTPANAPLALRPDARVEFHCRVEPGVGEVLLKARYYILGQLIGSAQRRTAVGHAPPAMTLGPDDGVFGDLSPEGFVDLTVTVTRSRRQNLLRWTIVAPDPPLAEEATTDLDAADARRFAAELIRDLSNAGVEGPAATNTLLSGAQEIAGHMPPQFFAALRSVHSAIGRTPSLLILSDESFLPWELALLETPLLDDAAPAFLGAQTNMGRWLEDPNAMLPPARDVEVERISAVAVSAYETKSGLRTLKEAVAERKKLEDDWGAIALEGTKLGIQPLLGVRIPGHLLHIATHGLSNPAANDQALLLADGWPLQPASLIGVYRRGDVPRFAFVFLNACQVGVPGSSLGQAAGFPGLLVRRGTLGFIAPFWEVDDKQACSLAEAFYKSAFGSGVVSGAAVGEVLRDQRKKFVEGGPIAPVAYVYYGHPSLRLHRR